MLTFEREGGRGRDGARDREIENSKGETGYTFGKDTAQ